MIESSTYIYKFEIYAVIHGVLTCRRDMHTCFTNTVLYGSSKDWGH